MDRAAPPPSRDERLAAQLRANLKRRKAQARALAADPSPAGTELAPPLPKPPASG